MTGIGDQTRLRAQIFLTGTYQFWRYSSLCLDFSSRGCCKSGSHPLMHWSQRYISASSRTIPYLRLTFVSKTSITLVMPSGSLGVDVSFGSLNQGSHHIRFAILTESSFNKARDVNGMKIFAMTGMVMGVDSARSFVSPVYVERVSDAVGFCRDEAIRKLKNGLNLYSEEFVPQRVLAYLREFKAQKF